MAFKLSRRALFQSAAATAVLSTTQAGAAPKLQTTVVLLGLSGGHHQMFSSADTMVNHSKGGFGVTASNIVMTAGGFGVDAGTFGQLGDLALNNAATVGVAHGIGAHLSGYRACFFDGNTSLPIKLATAMGGAHALKCVQLGPEFPGPSRAMGEVSMQKIPDVTGLLAALGLSSNDPTLPTRDASSAAIRLVQKLSARRYQQHPNALLPFAEANQALQGVLQTPPVTLNWAEVARAYGMPAGATAIGDLASRFAAAELLVRADVNVIAISDVGGYDDHDDTTGEFARNRYATGVIPSLRTFLNRTLAMPNRQVITCVMGEFGRDTDSNHAGVTCANVFGTGIRPGTTGRIIAESCSLPQGTAGWQGFYALLASAAGAEPVFGANPHDLVRTA